MIIFDNFDSFLSIIYRLFLTEAFISYDIEAPTLWSYLIILLDTRRRVYWASANSGQLRTTF